MNPESENDDLADDEIRGIMDAQNRDDDPDGDPLADDPGAHEEYADEDPPPMLNLDANDDFRDLLTGDGDGPEDDPNESFDDE